MQFRIEKKESFQIMGLSGYDSAEKEGSLTPLWNKFMKEYDPKLWNNGRPSYYTEPFYKVSAYFCTPGSDKVKTIIGAEYKEAKPEGITLSVETIPAATWAVFSFYGQTGYDKYDEAYTRILQNGFRQANTDGMKQLPIWMCTPAGKSMRIIPGRSGCPFYASDQKRDFCQDCH